MEDRISELKNLVSELEAENKAIREEKKRLMLVLNEKVDELNKARARLFVIGLQCKGIIEEASMK